jgi:excisionase family DNA binding protein
MPITVSLKHAANASGLSIRTLYILISSGRLKTAKVGKRRLIFYDSLRQFLEQSGRSGEPPSTK